MKLDDLQPGDVVDRWRFDESPMLYERRLETTLVNDHGDLLKTNYTYVFRDLETWEVVLVHTKFLHHVQRSKRWELMERSSQVGHSGSVDSDAGSQNGLTSKRK